MKKQKFGPVLGTVALAVTCHDTASAASLNTGSNSGVFQALVGSFAGRVERLDTTGPDNGFVFDFPDATIADGTFSTTAYSNEIRKLANRYLYRKLSKYPALVQTNTIYQSFYNTHYNGVIGKFEKVDKDIQALYVMNASTESQVKANFEGIALKLDEIANIDSLAASNGGLTINMEQLRGEAVQSISIYTESTKTLMQPVMVQRILDAASLDAQNNAIVTTSGDVPDWNQKEVNKIFINTLAVGNTTFSEAQYSTLTSIAAQCPLTGGSAVFKARSLLSIVSDTKYDDDVTCNPRDRDAHKALKKLDESVAFQVFPNPAQNEITTILPINSLTGDERKIVVYNAVGTKILEIDIPANMATFKFDISGLADGPVLVSLLGKGVQIASEKVLIIH